MGKKLFLEQNLKKGEEYAGLILGKNGEPDYHIALLPGQFKGNWKDSIAWAKKQGGELPNRQEARVLWANAQEHFKTDDAHWLSTPSEGDDASAWAQLFNNGDQTWITRSGRLYARAVRRILIIQ